MTNNNVKTYYLFPKGNSRGVLCRYEQELDRIEPLYTVGVLNLSDNKTMRSSDTYSYPLKMKDFKEILVHLGHILRANFDYNERFNPRGIVDIDKMNGVEVTMRVIGGENLEDLVNSNKKRAAATVKNGRH